MTICAQTVRKGAVIAALAFGVHTAAHRFDFPALKAQPRLEVILDVVIVARLAIFRDAGVA